MSRIFDLADILVTSWRALDGYGEPGHRTGIPVFDGPNASQLTPATFVVVGAPSFVADPDTDPTSGTSDAEWVSVPATAGSQREAVTLNCAITSWTGNAPDGFPDWSALRVTVSAVLDDLRDACRTLTGLDNCIYLALTNGRLVQEFTSDGAFVTFEFTAEARFLI